MMSQQNKFQLIKGLVLIGGIYRLEPLITTSFNDAIKLTELFDKIIILQTQLISKNSKYSLLYFI